MPRARTTYDSAMVERIRRFADSGRSRGAIAEEFGLSIDALNRIMARFGITTHARRGVRPKPVKKVEAMRNGFGKPPADLMPSREALAAASIWSFATHAPIAIRSSNEVITNDNENQSLFRKASSWTA